MELISEHRDITLKLSMDEFRQFVADKLGKNITDVGTFHLHQTPDGAIILTGQWRSR